MRCLVSFVVAIVTALLGGAALAQAPTAETFARPATLWSATLSPNGRYVAAIQSVEQGEAVVIIDWRTRQAQVVSIARRDRSLFLEAVGWKNDDRLIFVLRQRASVDFETLGSRNRQGESREVDVIRLFAVNRDGSNVVQLLEGQMNRLAWRGAPIRLIDSLPNDPDHVLVGTWGPRGYTVYRANVTGGGADAVEDGGWDTFNFIVDVTGRPVMRVDALPYGSGFRYYRRGPSERSWTLAHEVRRTQRTENRDFAPIAAGPRPGSVYVAAREPGRDFQAIYLYDTATGALGQPVFEYEGADVAVAWLNRRDSSLIGGCGEHQRRECRALDPAMQRHFDGIRRYFEQLADFSLISTSADGQLWLIEAFGPTFPTTYFIYDPSAALVSPVAPAYPHIRRDQLSPTRFETYTARDGVSLWGYWTAPRGGTGPFPTIILPHGGPQARDSFEYDFLVQFLVSRGYAVFQPNFRGSEGSGRAFAEAGFRQWGGLMQDDITDAVGHLTQAGLADASRVCIVGISYGGYAALAGAALTPDLYRCAISIAGVSDLPEMIEAQASDSGRRSAFYATDVERVGDPQRDRDVLIAASPRRQVDRIRVPVLLIHGERDEVVSELQSERMRDAMQRAGKNVRYVEIPGVYHPWDGWTNRETQLMLEEIDQFLSANLPR